MRDMAARGLEPGGAMAQHLNLEDLIDLGGEKRGDGEGGGLSSSPLLAVDAAAEQTGAGWSLPFAPSPMTGGIELLHSPTPQKALRSAARSVERSRLGNGSNTPLAPISMNKLDSSPAESEDEVVIHVKARGKTPGARRRQRRSTLSATASADASADAVPPTGRSLLAQSPMPAVQHPASLKVALKTTEACAAKPKTPVSTKPEEGSSVPTLVSHFETIATTPTGDAIDAVPPAGGSKLALTPIAGGADAADAADAVPPAGGSKLALTPIAGGADAADAADAVPPAGGSKLALTPEATPGVVEAKPLSSVTSPENKASLSRQSEAMLTPGAVASADADAVPPAGGSTLALTPIIGNNAVDAVPPAGGSRLAATPPAAPAAAVGNETAPEATVPAGTQEQQHGSPAEPSPPVRERAMTPEAVTNADENAVPPAGGSRLMLTPVVAAPRARRIAGGGTEQAQGECADACVDAGTGPSSPVARHASPAGAQEATGTLPGKEVERARREGESSIDSPVPTGAEEERAVANDGCGADVDMMDVDSPAQCSCDEEAAAGSGALVDGQVAEVVAQLDLDTAEAGEAKTPDNDDVGPASQRAAACTVEEEGGGSGSDNFEAYLERMMSRGGDPFAAGKSAIGNSPAIKAPPNPYTPLRKNRGHDPYACTKRF